MISRLILLTLMLSTYKASAVEYFVSRSCTSSKQTGAKTTPFCTIQQGVDIARAGDIVSVRGGTYAGSVTFRYSGVSGRPITLRSYPGERAIIDQGSNYSTTTTNVNRVTLKAAAGYKYPIGWIVIEGMEIARGYDGIKLYNAYDIIIRGNNIHHSLSQGVVGNGLRVTLDRNIVAYNGNAKARGLASTTNQLHGIYLAGSNHKIINNVIHSNLCHGLQMAGTTYTSDYYRVEYGGARNWLVANNTFAYQKNCAGMTVWKSEARYTSIMNNIFYENSMNIAGPNGISFYGSGGGNTVKNNLFYSSKNYEPIFSTSGGLYTSSANLIQAKPLFKSASACNFRLLSGSPGINKGLKSSSIPMDFDKVARPQGSTHDIGAFEFR